MSAPQADRAGCRVSTSRDLSAMWNEHCSYNPRASNLLGLRPRRLGVIRARAKECRRHAIGDGQAGGVQDGEHNIRATSSPISGRRYHRCGGSCATTSRWCASHCLSTRSPLARRKIPKNDHWCRAVGRRCRRFSNSFGCRPSGGQVRFHNRYDGTSWSTR